MKRSFINDNLLVPKALYFLCYCFMYAPSLYQAKYLEDIWSIHSKNYGYMNLVTVFSIVASLGWSAIADKYRLHKRVLMIKVMLYGLSYCMMWFLEPFIADWTLNFRMSVITFLFFTTTVFCSAIFPLLGILVFSILEASPILRNGTVPPKRLLGRQKLFGTFGLGAVYALNGYLTDLIGFRAQFLIVIFSCTIFFLVALFGLDRHTSYPESVTLDKEQDYQKEKAIFNHDSNGAPYKKEVHWFQSVQTLLKNWNFLLLLLVVFQIGSVSAVFNVYFSVFMGKIMPDAMWKNQMMGYMNTIRLAVEIPVYVWGDILLKVFGSHGVLMIGMLAAVIRPFGYSFFMTDSSRAYLGFFFELFKGFSHACNGLGGCVLASDLAPQTAQGVAQALFTSAHHHASSVISGLLCGLYLTYRKIDKGDVLFQISVYRDLFFWTGFIALFGSILSIIRIIFILSSGNNKHIK